MKLKILACFYISVFFTMLFTWSLSNAELLIVKKLADGNIASLNESDDALQDNLTELLLKYQWPTCITACALDKLGQSGGITITPEEKIELFSSNIPWGEERFIQKKISALYGDKYHVIFVPTTLYELYVLNALFSGVQKPRSLSPDVSANKKIFPKFLKMLKIEKFLADPDAAKTLMLLFVAINDYFREDIKIQNKSMTAWLLENLGQINLKTIEALNLAIKNSVFVLKEKLIDSICDIKFSPAFLKGSSILIDLQSRLRPLGLSSDPNAFINQIINIEYLAREKNKALLLRGSSPFNIEGYKVMLYPEQNKSLLSVSFANSLFAGVINGQNSCAYWFLRTDHKKIRGSSSQPVGFDDSPSDLGFALYIDKALYERSHCNDLFYIPALHTAVAIWQSGDSFHARTKIALPRDYKGSISGFLFLTPYQKDPCRIILIDRDRHEHAELLSKYFAGNAVVLLKDGMIESSIIKQNQLDLAMIERKKRDGISKTNIAKTEKRWKKPLNAVKFIKRAGGEFIEERPLEKLKGLLLTLQKNFLILTKKLKTCLIQPTVSLGQVFSSSNSFEMLKTSLITLQKNLTILEANLKMLE